MSKLLAYLAHNSYLVKLIQKVMLDNVLKTILWSLSEFKHPVEISFVSLLRLTKTYPLSFYLPPSTQPQEIQVQLAIFALCLNVFGLLKKVQSSQYAQNHRNENFNNNKLTFNEFKAPGTVNYCIFITQF